MKIKQLEWRKKDVRGAHKFEANTTIGTFYIMDYFVEKLKVGFLARLPCGEQLYLHFLTEKEAKDWCQEVFERMISGCLK